MDYFKFFGDPIFNTDGDDSREENVDLASWTTMLNNLMYINL
jgi:hypothetical protein